MNNKVIIGIVVIALLVGIGLIVKSNKGNAPSDQTPTIAPQVATEPTTQATTSSQPTQQQNTITLTSEGFSPATLTIKAGNKVTWVNKSGTSATVNSDPHPTHTDYPPLNLGSFAAGETLSLTFDKSGTFGFHNHLNPSQKGAIAVQ